MPKTTTAIKSSAVPTGRTVVRETQPRNFRAGIPFLPGRWLSLRAALSGAAYTIRTQPNAWIELTALAVVCAAGWWVGISALEWGLLGLTIAVVLAMEAVNTAVEAVVDLVSPQYHPLAKIAKDTAAGAMIFVVLGSIAVAGSIFGPRLWTWWF
jgi:diacylglycerol kinase (ATP)